MKFGQFMSCYNNKIIKKFYKNCDLRTSSRPLYVCKELNKTSIGKSNILKQATNIRYVIAKLSKSIQIRVQTSLNSFLQKILWKLKRAKTEKFSFAVLHKQTRFHYQTAFTLQVIQLNVSCLGIWWRWGIWISEKLKFDYLENEKSFQIEIKFSTEVCFLLNL